VNKRLLILGVYIPIYPPSLRPWPAGKKLVKNEKSSRVIRETHATLVWRCSWQQLKTRWSNCTQGCGIRARPWCHTSLFFASISVHVASSRPTNYLRNRRSRSIALNASSTSAACRAGLNTRIFELPYPNFSRLEQSYCFITFVSLLGKLLYLIQIGTIGPLVSDEAINFGVKRLKVKVIRGLAEASSCLPWAVTFLVSKKTQRL